jgi:hypothetical protein
MNKHMYMTTHDFFRKIAESGGDGRAHIGHYLLCIEKCNDI